VLSFVQVVLAVIVRGTLMVAARAGPASSREAASAAMNLALILIMDGMVVEGKLSQLKA
jgi:hypothetical protein